MIPLALGACGFRVDGATPDADDQPPSDGDEHWLTGFTARRPIDLAGATAAIPDFVASVTEDADPELVGKPALAFTAADGKTLLGTELVAFDQATGKLEAWVATSLAAGAPTRIYLYYGGGAAPVAPSPWGGLYAGVWHMTGSGATAPDSKLHNDATATLTAIPGSVTGIVGDARGYDGIDDTMIIPDPTDGSLDFDMTSFSAGVWVYVDQSRGGFDIPVFKGGTTAGAPGFDFELGTGTWNAGFADLGSNYLVPFGLEVDLLHDWHYLVSVLDRANPGGAAAITYLDGAPVQAMSVTLDSLSSSFDVNIGESPSYLFKGNIDEVRIYTAAIAPERVAADYSNIVHRAQFVTIGPPEHRD